MLIDRLDPESVLPVALMRSHTRTDDMPNVSDAQLALYRKAALEACEQYTGRKWTRRERITQDVGLPESSLTRDRRRSRVRLDYPTDDGVIVFSSPHGGQTITVMPGSRSIEIPVRNISVDTWACCGGCDKPVNWGASITYTTGVCKADDMPAGVILGCLKYIAWAVENPGDQLVTVAGVKTTGQELAGTNNGTWGSGAIDLWRQYRNGIVS